MKKMNLGLLLLVSVFISGCSMSKNNVVKSINDFFKTDSIETYKTIGEATYDTAFDLSNLKNIKELQKRKLIVTSLVDVNNFKQTSNFGRLYSESMITDLRDKNWDVIDFRGQKITTISKTGEFYLDREKLASFPANSFIYVGTYGTYKNGLLVNQRLIHMLDNKVITASSLLLKDKKESLFLSKVDNCKKLGCNKEPKMKMIKEKKNDEKFMMKIVEDDCMDGKDCNGAKK